MNISAPIVAYSLHNLEKSEGRQKKEGAYGAHVHLEYSVVEFLYAVFQDKPRQLQKAMDRTIILLSKRGLLIFGVHSVYPRGSDLSVLYRR